MVKLSAQVVRALVAAVVDPEMPVLTIEDLGILRDVRIAGDRVEVDITPTYSGCPALEAIRSDIQDALREHGWKEISVQTVLVPPWTSDWMSDAGKRKLREFGIMPPRLSRPIQIVRLPKAQVQSCPQCQSSNVHELSRFSSTACKSLYRCNDCREPFEYFKPH